MIKSGAKLCELESVLVSMLTERLKNQDNPFSVVTVGLEFGHHSGRVDLVAVSDIGELWTFEAKLKKWRDAVHQAYRNTSFAHYSYVLLPTKIAENAFRYEREFQRRGIGLCTIDESQITILIRATRKEPIQPWITENAIEHAVPPRQRI